MAHFRHELKPTGEGYRNRECPTHHKTLKLPASALFADMARHTRRAVSSRSRDTTKAPERSAT